MHEVLLKNPDGSFSPMDETFFESEEIASGDYRILSSGDYSYVISDGKEGIAVDGGYGIIRGKCSVKEIADGTARSR